MPDRITFDEALTSSKKTAPQAITIDDVLAHREQQAQPSSSPFGAPAGQQTVARNGQYVNVPEPKEAPGANFGASFKQAVIADPDTQRRELAKSLFPNDPNGINRVGFADGEAVFVDDSGNLRYVSSRPARFAAGVAGNLPEIVAGTIGAFATGNPITGGAIAAAGGRAFKRGLSELIFDEPATPASVGAEMLEEGALNAVSGVVGKGVVKGADRGKIVDFTPRDMAAAEATRQRVKGNTGIDIDLAQASGDRKLAALRGYSARYPGESADMIQATDERALDQFSEAANRTLDSIANSKPSEFYGKDGINAAKKAISEARKEIQKEVGPLYREAYAAVPVIDRTTKQGETILDYLKLPYFKEAFSAGQKLKALETGSTGPRQRTVETLTKAGDDAIERALTSVDSTATGAKRITSRLSTEQRPVETPDGTLTRRSETVHTDITQPSLEELDYTKRALDERIEALFDAGQRQRAEALKKKRDEFVTALDALPNQQWQKARQTYGALAEQKLKPLEEGAVGIIAKIQNPKAATAAAKIFNDPNVTPEQIAFARAQISKQDPEAWNGLVRQWMGQKFNQAMKETQTGDVINPAGKFRQAVFGTPQDRKRAVAMLPAGSAPVFYDLMEAAEKLASTPISGSNTMRDTEIKDQLKGTGAVIFRWLTSPRQQAVNAAEQRALDQGTLAITEGLLDPAKRSQLKRVVRMAPSTKQAILISSILAGQTAKVAAASSDDLAPPSLDKSSQ